MWFYNFGLILYVWAIRLVAPRHPKARLWIEGRKDLFRRMREAIDPSDRIIWIHVASLGEFEQGRPIIEQLRKTHPEYKILLTFFSPSGYEIRKDYKAPSLRRSTTSSTFRSTRRATPVVSSTPRIPKSRSSSNTNTGSTCSANCGAGKSAPTSCRLSSAATRSSSAPTAACGGRRWSRST